MLSFNQEFKFLVRSGNTSLMVDTYRVKWVVGGGGRPGLGGGYIDPI